MKVLVIKESWLFGLLKAFGYAIGFSLKTVSLGRLAFEEQYKMLSSMPKAWIKLWKQDKRHFQRLVRWYIGDPTIKFTIKNGFLHLIEDKLLLKPIKKDGTFRLYRQVTIDGEDFHRIVETGKMHTIMPHVVTWYNAVQKKESPYPSGKTTQRQRKQAPLQRRTATPKQIVQEVTHAEAGDWTQSIPDIGR